MDPIQVLSLGDLNDEHLGLLRSVPGISLHQLAPGEDIQPHLATAEVMLIHDTSFGLERAPRLRWLQTISAGVDHLPLAEIQRASIHLTTASGVHAVPIAEHVFALMLAWVRRLPVAWHCSPAGDWQQARPAMQGMGELQGATLGIVGYGSIGRQVARVGQALGMRVLALRRAAGRREQGWGEPGTGDPAGKIPVRLYRTPELLALLPQCDFVVLALPLTPATRGIIGERELAALKPGAFLVNIARGGLVDEPALIRALQKGQLAGAGLDVFACEPLPADSPLYRMENVFFTPHVAGNSQAHNGRLTRLFAENLRRYVEAQPLLNEVEWDRGY